MLVLVLVPAWRSAELRVLVWDETLLSEFGPLPGPHVRQIHWSSISTAAIYFTS